MKFNPYPPFAKPTIEFCESNLGGWINQPANALSSLFISAAGIYVLSQKRQYRFQNWLGWIAIFTGLASFSYYATFSRLGQLADLSGMFMLATVLLLIAQRSRRLTPARVLLTVFLGTILPIILTAAYRTIGGFNLGIPLFAGLIVWLLTAEVSTIKSQMQSGRDFWWALFWLFIGLIAWQLDYKQIWCDAATAHWLNGHAVWHLTNGLSILKLHRHYSK